MQSGKIEDRVRCPYCGSRNCIPTEKYINGEMYFRCLGDCKHVFVPKTFVPKTKEIKSDENKCR